MFPDINEIIVVVNVVKPGFGMHKFVSDLTVQNVGGSLHTICIIHFYKMLYKGKGFGSKT